MLNSLLLILCMTYMAFLSHRWLGVTATMQETNRQKRLLNLLDWHEKPEAPAKKKGLFSF